MLGIGTRKDKDRYSESVIQRDRDRESDSKETKDTETERIQ